MSFETDSIDFLAKKIEEWIAVSPKRNLSSLQRKSGVSYSTLRRVAQRESLPSDSSTLSILYVVASRDEILSYLKDKNPGFYKFYLDTILDQKRTKTEEEISARFSCKNSFICLVLAYTIGATREHVEKLLGSVGTNTLYQLADEGYLKEIGGVFTPNSQNAHLDVWNQQIYKKVSTLISEISSHTDKGQNLYFFYNVTEEDYSKIKNILAEAVSKAIDIARESNGNLPIMHTTVTTNLLDIER